METKLYGAILADPFLDAGLVSPPGIPTAPAFPSRKWRTAIKGSFSTGTNGTGFVYIDPYHTVFNDVPCGSYSEAAYAGSNFVGTTTTGVSSFNNIQSPYATATLANGILARLVACGIRVRYTGTALNRGGSLVGVYTRDDYSTLSNRNYSGVLTNFPYVSAQSVSEEWEGATWFPTNNASLDYYNPGEIFTYNWYDFASLGVMVYSPNSVTLTFDFEVVCFWEYQGPGVISLSPSSSDFLGMSNVIEGASRVQTGPEKGWLSSFVSATADAIETTSEWMYSHPRTVQVLSAGASHLLRSGNTQYRAIEL